MLKRIKRFLLFIILFIITLLIPYDVFAYDYVINSYDINMIVNENNTFNITETLGVYFNIDKHGIYRKIPIKNTITRLDGTTSTNLAKISDISVNDKYSVYTENEYKVIKIGNKNYTMVGSKNYTISYSYDLGRDTGKGYDELYFNLIGSEWDTQINNISFTITMPKEFDKSKIGFSQGEVGSTSNYGVTYNVNDNVITGNLNKTLRPGEALTIRIELPEGYFTQSGINLDYIQIVLPILFVLISFVLWLIYGKDNKVIETIEFYPPEDYNSLEIGYFYKGKADKKDIVSLLIYLANKGYIKITEMENELFPNRKIIKIIKLKEYDGNNINEHLFFKGLFNKRSTLITMDDNVKYGEEVTLFDLKNEFYITMEKILSNINNTKELRNKVFEKSSFYIKKIIIILIFITYFLISLNATGGLFELLFYYIGFTTIYDILTSKKTPSALLIFSNIFSIFLCLLIIGLPFCFLVLPILLENKVKMITYIIGVLCIIILAIIHANMLKRTPYGNELLGKIKGFKNFLKTAEKDNLEQFVMKDPTYFYDILPYAYILDISDKWIKKFESITINPPTWYDSTSSFDIDSFGSFMDSMMSSAESSMSSSSNSDSSGSSSSGGGSSGGGSGGGGGGSW